MLHLGKKIYRHTGQTEMLCSHLGNAYFILVDMGYMFFARSLFLEFVFSRLLLPLLLLRGHISKPANPH